MISFIDTADWVGARKKDAVECQDGQHRNGCFKL